MARTVGAARKRDADLLAAPLLVDLDADHASGHHPECTRSADGDIDDAAAHERPTVVDDALDGTSPVPHCDNAPHGFCPHRAGHAVTAAAVVGGETALGVS